MNLDFKALANMTPAETVTKAGDNEQFDEIARARLGMVTGSTFGNLVVQTKDKKGYTLSQSETALNLIYKIAWERLLLSGNISNGLGRLSMSSKPTEHGHEYEQEAIQKYMELTGREIDYKQHFIAQDEYIGGTPDGFIGDDGIIEIKCPWNGGNHIKSMLTGQIYNRDYVYQIQGYLWITGRKWCDFITYDPDLCEGLQLNIIRVERDESIIDGISSVMEKVKLKIQEILQNDKFITYKLR